MAHILRKISKNSFDGILLPLLETPEPPEELYVEGTLPSLTPQTKTLAVVGSRNNTRYGREVCEMLIKGLSHRPIVIVSGLALGIDGIAHEAALDAGLQTIAVPGSGLSRKVLYPSTHKKLADKIVESGGALISEFEPEFRATNWSFPKRNRVMAGLSDAILVIEAEEKSGTLITARLALDYNRTVLVVPGNITEPTSVGTNSLIRLGATPITKPADILEALGFDVEEVSVEQIQFDFETLNDHEKTVWELLHTPTPREDIIRDSGLTISDALTALSLLEMKGLIEEKYGEIKRLTK